ncbi:hypothetical protein EYF80_038499 [Liparis tanakae]|uniref:Uncharacterized protein n=1 Tax=Liparis tanakae TaxID=230148 RepID=A0A4Z2GDL1_9TELE|nr:hypothetical protein EYF80_038499 [Liparis tanakae]
MDSKGNSRKDDLKEPRWGNRLRDERNTVNISAYHSILFFFYEKGKADLTMLSALVGDETLERRRAPEADFNSEKQRRLLPQRNVGPDFSSRIIGVRCSTFRVARVDHGQVGGPTQPLTLTPNGDLDYLIKLIALCLVDFGELGASAPKGLGGNSLRSERPPSLRGEKEETSLAMQVPQL